MPTSRPIIWLLATSLLAMAALAQAQPAPRPVSGRLVFLRCASCHSIVEGVTGRIGPNLHGVVGRPSGSLPGYAYSPAMRAAHLVWDAPTLDRWLTRPTALVPGTAMAFAGLPNEADRKAVISYLTAAGH